MQSHQKQGGELGKWVSLCLCCLKCSMCVTSQCKRSPWAGAREERPLPPQAGAPTAGVGEEQVEAGESRTGGPRPGRWSALCPCPWKTDERLLCTRQTLLWVSAQMIRGGRQGSPHFIDSGLQTVEMTENRGCGTAEGVIGSNACRWAQGWSSFKDPALETVLAEVPAAFSTQEVVLTHRLCPTGTALDRTGCRRPHIQLPFG